MEIKIHMYIKTRSLRVFSQIIPVIIDIEPALKRKRKKNIARLRGMVVPGLWIMRILKQLWKKKKMMKESDISGHWWWGCWWCRNTSLLYSNPSYYIVTRLSIYNGQSLRKELSGWLQEELTKSQDELPITQEQEKNSKTEKGGTCPIPYST